MKTILICLLATLGIFATSCGRNNGRNDSIAEAESAAAAAYGPAKGSDSLPYEYSEEVPVPAPGEVDPSVAEVQSDKIPYVVDFYADWCEPCQRLKPYFKQYEETFKGQADFGTINVDTYPEVAKRNNVSTIPTVIIFADKSMKQELFRVTGFAPEQIEDALMENL